MKTLLTAIALLTSLVVGAAQNRTVTLVGTNPLTNSFLTMGTNGTQLRSTGVLVTNLTNLVGIGSINNVYITTNNLGLWTNILGELQPTSGTSVLVTNLFSQTTLTAGGSFTLLNAATINLDAGTNCVNPANLGTIDVVGFSANPAASTLSLEQGTGPGQLLIIRNAGDSILNQFTMQNGALMCDGSGGAIRLNGDWVSTTEGEALFLMNTGNWWSEIGRVSVNTNVITGDNVWENVSGLIRPVNGNTNNLVSITSGMADNATNVALIVNTTNYWSADDSILAVFKNAGTNRVAHGPLGGTALGIGGNVDYPGTSGVGLSSVSNKEKDGVPQASIFSTILNSDFDAEARMTLDTNADDVNNASAELIVESYGSVNSFWTLKSALSGGVVVGQFKFEDDEVRLNFRPNVLSGESAVAYLFDTSNTLTDGDSLILSRNQGVDHFRVDGNSGYSGAGTKFLSDDGTYKTVSSGATINPTDGFLPYRINSTTFGDTPIQTNDTTSVKITDGSGTLTWGIGAGSNPYLLGVGGSGSFGIIGPGGYGLNIQNTHINPLLTGTDLSGPNVTDDFWFNSIGIDLGGVFVRGFYDGISSNNVYASIIHTGTNGVVEFASRSVGIGGAAKSFQFQSNNVVIAKIDANSGYAGGGTKFLSDNGTYQTVSAGTTINPTDGYLPYRTNSTTFADSPWYRIETNALGFNGTTRFLHTTGTENTFLGDASGAIPVSGATGNTALGALSLKLITSGDDNVAIGAETAENLTTGSRNTILGAFTADNGINVTGTDNVIAGAYSARDLTNGSFNVYLGAGVNQTVLASQTNAIGIGYGVTVPSNNTTWIGNTNTTTAYIIASGFANSGTKFLSDDGTYKTVVSGATQYDQLIHPHRADQVGAVILTSDPSSVNYGHALFSGTAATNANFIEYRWQVPKNINTSVDLEASWSVMLNAADTSASTYTIGMASVAASSSYAAPTLGNYVTLTIAADASGAQNDYETVQDVTLTGWAAALTAGQVFVIRVARDGAGDTSNVAHYDAGLTIKYSVQ